MSRVSRAADLAYSKACEEIISKLYEAATKGKITGRDYVDKIKHEICAKYSLPKCPSNSELIEKISDDLEKFPVLIGLLRKRRVRSLSGVAVVAVMTKPYPCPHGKCAYCPGGPEQDVPQSYTGREPATLRGAQHAYDPAAQVKARIKQLMSIGHPTSKIDLIIMGGTFPSTPINYQEWFVKRCIDAMNHHDSKSLIEAQKFNETAPSRCIGLTIETRPDYCKEPHLDLMLTLGATRVEIGVQTLYDDIYKKIERGHKVEDVAKAFQLARDAGLKIGAHMMPSLPEMDYRRDLEAFHTLFNDPRFKPDMLKIYPTLVLEGTKLYEWWKKGEYTPYHDEELIRLIAEIKAMVPPWLRIQRIQRDIPVYLIKAGPKIGHLRDVVKRYMKNEGLKCKCIRCHEAGLKAHKEGVTADVENVCLRRQSYEASGGEEIFLSYEDMENDVLVGFLRLRIPSKNAHRPEIGEKTAIVRELRIYGLQVPIGEKFEKAWQHKGWGSSLLSTAEKIAREEYDMKKLLVTSGIGVRPYYREKGYDLLGPYMAKNYNNIELN
ncbi:MAG: tRNA uridine(34) 5-carboxymethylaminomethyl modification radical SAM/GNAT enzyme Elp3 [Candidatus Hodarchaeota archaeon]